MTPTPPVFTIAVLPDALEITVDVPGFDRHNLRLDVSETTVYLNAHDGGRDYRSKIPLPVPAAPETAAASCRNGVLTITVRKWSDDAD